MVSVDVPSTISVNVPSTSSASDSAFSLFASASAFSFCACASAFSLFACAAAFFCGGGFFPHRDEREANHIDEAHWGSASGCTWKLSNILAGAVMDIRNLVRCKPGDRVLNFSQTRRMDLRALLCLW